MLPAKYIFFGLRMLTPCNWIAFSLGDLLSPKIDVRLGRRPGGYGVFGELILTGPGQNLTPHIEQQAGQDDVAHVDQYG